MDQAGSVHWVQTRPLTHKIARVVELVDRRGYAADGGQILQGTGHEGLQG